MHDPTRQAVIDGLIEDDDPIVAVAFIRRRSPPHLWVDPTIDELDTLAEVHDDLVRAAEAVESMIEEDGDISGMTAQ